MKECSICTETKGLITCPDCGGIYCKIHYEYHKNNYCKKKKNKEEKDE